MIFGSSHRRRKKQKKKRFFLYLLCLIFLPSSVTGLDGKKRNKFLIWSFEHDDDEDNQRCFDEFSWSKTDFLFSFSRREQVHIVESCHHRRQFTFKTNILLSTSHPYTSFRFDLHFLSLSLVLPLDIFSARTFVMPTDEYLSSDTEVCIRHRNTLIQWQKTCSMIYSKSKIDRSDEQLSQLSRRIRREESDTDGTRREQLSFVDTVNIWLKHWHHRISSWCVTLLVAQGKIDQSNEALPKWVDLCTHLFEEFDPFFSLRSLRSIQRSNRWQD